MRMRLRQPEADVCMYEGGREPGGPGWLRVPWRLPGDGTLVLEPDGSPAVVVAPGEYVVRFDNGFGISHYRLTAAQREKMYEPVPDDETGRRLDALSDVVRELKSDIAHIEMHLGSIK